MKKEEILTNIKNIKPREGHNSMGASENWYNPYYMISECFPFEELENMQEKELQNLVKLAELASDVFY